MNIIIIGVVLLLAGFVVFCRQKKRETDLDGILMVTGIVLVLIGMLVVLGKEYREEEVQVPTTKQLELDNKTVAGVTEVMSVELGNDYHYQYPQVELADVDLLARLITAEQGYNAGEDAYYYTASVVWNRMNSDKFPDEMRDVIYQPGQYQCVDNGHIEREYDDLAWEVAVAVLEDGTWIPENVVYQAEFVQGSGVWEQVGRTYFCYE